MEVIVSRLTGWNEVMNLARTTINKATRNAEPSDKFKRRILDAEHSPIRALMFRVELIGIPYWVSVHLVRHKFGVEHYIGTQRTDRTGEDRTLKSQDAPVNHTMVLNAQELLFISRRRLCHMASPETRKVWQMVKCAVSGIDQIVADYMVPMCVYRGGVCHEHPGCGHYKEAKV